MQVVAKTPKSPLLKPHKYSNGKYVVSKTRFQRDYVYVSLDEIPSYIAQGFRVRMSDPVTHETPRLISRRSITVRP
jgi:hypothetical protein